MNIESIKHNYCNVIYYYRVSKPSMIMCFRAMNDNIKIDIIYEILKDCGLFSIGGDKDRIIFGTKRYIEDNIIWT
jgi:hypothetical protein